MILVKITSCSNNTIWYNKYIGKRFFAKDVGHGLYEIINTPKEDKYAMEVMTKSSRNGLFVDNEHCVVNDFVSLMELSIKRNGRD